MNIRHIIQRSQPEAIPPQIVEHHAKGNVSRTESLMLLGKINRRLRQCLVLQQGLNAAGTAVISLDQKQREKLIPFIIGQVTEARLEGRPEVASILIHQFEGAVNLCQSMPVVGGFDPAVFERRG